MMTARRRLQGRRSFTLAEMLIVIAIIGLVSSSVLMAMWGAMEEAKEVRTRAQIQKLHELLMMRWEGYRTRPVPISIPANTNPRLAAERRLLAVREMMRMELPDRLADIGTDPVILPRRPSLSASYLRRVDNAFNGSSWRSSLPNSTSSIPNSFFEGAECLYMIIAATQYGSSSGLDFFQEREIGDVDEDGLPEILDGWGNPIEFFRWAPDYTGGLQTGDTESADGNAGEAPDPFDPLRVDYRWRDGDGANDPSALFPLVVSPGRDGEYGLKPINSLIYSTTVQPTPGSMGSPWPNDPYHIHTDANGNNYQVGAPADPPDQDGWRDNISNHLLLVE